MDGVLGRNLKQRKDDAVSNTDRSAFPIRIMYVDTKKVKTVETPEKIESDRPFKVLKTHLKRKLSNA